MKNSWVAAMIAWSLAMPHAHAGVARPAAKAPVIYKVGQVTRHAKTFEGKELAVQGYLLAAGKDYFLFSDEASGAVGPSDLPVTGPGVSGMRPNVKYLLHGMFIRSGLVASNGNPDHLALTAPPMEWAK